MSTTAPPTHRVRSALAGTAVALIAAVGVVGVPGLADAKPKAPTTEASGSGCVSIKARAEALFEEYKNASVARRDEILREIDRLGAAWKKGCPGQGSLGARVNLPGDTFEPVVPPVSIDEGTLGPRTEIDRGTGTVPPTASPGGSDEPDDRPELHPLPCDRGIDENEVHLPESPGTDVREDHDDLDEDHDDVGEDHDRDVPAEPTDPRDLPVNGTPVGGTGKVDDTITDPDRVMTPGPRPDGPITPEPTPKPTPKPKPKPEEPRPNPEPGPGPECGKVNLCLPPLPGLPA
jgi:hypothetical protein